MPALVLCHALSFRFVALKYNRLLSAFRAQALIQEFENRHKIWYTTPRTRNGEWPSGKAPGFGPGIRGFESLLPSQNENRSFDRSLFWLERFESPNDFCVAKDSGVRRSAVQQN